MENSKIHRIWYLIKYYTGAINVEMHPLWTATWFSIHSFFRNRVALYHAHNLDFKDLSKDHVRLLVSRKYVTAEEYNVFYNPLKLAEFPLQKITPTIGVVCIT